MTSHLLYFYLPVDAKVRFYLFYLLRKLYWKDWDYLQNLSLLYLFCSTTPGVYNDTKRTGKPTYGPLY